MHQQGEDEPAGWCLAKIITKRDKFYFIHYENYDNIYDEIVVIDQIRPVNTRDGPKLDDTEKIVTKVPAAILEWCTSPDAEAKFNTVIEKTGPYNVCFRPNEKQIIIVGEPKTVNRASILLNFIIEHQCELIELENENLKISKSLENKRQKIMKSDSLEEILVPKDLLGLIIGKGGANISYVKQEFGVGIHIMEDLDEEAKEYTTTVIPEGKALIRIYGKDPKWVALAKKEIFLQKIMLPIQSDKIEYIKGYQNVIINDMKEKSRCVKAFVHDAQDGNEESVIEVIGNEDAIENIKMLLDTHLSYYETYQEKDATSKELNKQVTKINNNYGEGFQQRDEGRGGYNNRRRNNKKY